MKRAPLTRLLAFPLVLPLVFACGGDDKGNDSTTGASSTDQGDGDGDNTPGDGDGEPTGDGDGDPTCTPGELNCECNGGQCLGDLDCEGNTCVESCIPGELGCECNGGQCLGDLDCVEDMCVNCIPGELGCECNDGQCLGDLDCVENVCTEGGGDGDGDGDGDCAPGLTLCDGECHDVTASDLHCGACNLACDIKDGLGGCEQGVCLPTWSECVITGDPIVSCNDVCVGEAKMCAEQGCGGTTLRWYALLQSCEGFFGSNGVSQCTAPTDPVNNVYRCCCQQ